MTTHIFDSYEEAAAFLIAVCGCHEVKLNGFKGGYEPYARGYSMHEGASIVTHAVDKLYGGRFQVLAN